MPAVETTTTVETATTLETAIPIEMVTPIRRTSPPGQRLSDPRYEWVPAGPFRAHVRHVSAATGTPWPVLAILARVSLPAVRGLMVGRRGRVAPRVCPDVAARLIQLSSMRVRQAALRPVPAERTVALLRHLRIDDGELAGRLGLDRDRLSALRRDHPPLTCSELVAAAVEAAYRQAWTQWCRTAIGWSESAELSEAA